MPTNHPHLARRGAIYHWRRRLPYPINQILKRSHWNTTLKTADPSRARILTRRLAVAIDLLAERLKDMPDHDLPTPGQLNFILKAIFFSILNEGEAQRRDRPPGPSPYEDWDQIPGYGDLSPHDQARVDEAIANGELAEPPEGEPEYPQSRAQTWEVISYLNDLDFIQPKLDRVLDEHGLAIPKEAPLYRRLARDATKVVAAAHKIEEERWNGDYHNGQAPPAWIDQDYPIMTRLIRTWAGQLTKDEVDFMSRQIEDVAEEYIERHLRHTRARKTERDWRVAVRYFVSLVGDVRVGDITEAHVDRFREELLDVPADYGKGIFAKITPKDAIKKRNAFLRALQEARQEGKERLRFDGLAWAILEAERKTLSMTRKTANKHLSFFTKMWKSRVVPSALRPVNPFTGSLYPKREVANDPAPGARTEYRKDELQKLFTSPVWNGCLSLKRRAKEGTMIIPDALFWCPLVSVFTGMRREEICQLKVGDFDEQDGILFLRVQATEGRRLKTPAAARDIPLHSELIKVGLMDFVEYRQQSDLFPELRPSKVNDSRGDSIGKWFYRYRRSIPEPVDREETDFHSFRTTFTQFLRRAGVPLDHIKPITGHQEYDVTLRHYAPAFSLQQKKAVIEKFDLGVKFSQLYGRMPELLRTLERVEESQRHAHKLRAGKRSFRAPAAAAE